MNYLCGLDVCEALLKINRKLSYFNFKLVVRVSKRHDGGRDESWTQKFVEKHLDPYSGQI